MHFFKKYMEYTFISTILILICIVGENWACVTPDGLNGKCINIYLCAPVMYRLNHRPAGIEFYIKLQRSNCGYEGFDPKICCPFESVPQVEQTTNQPERTTSTNPKARTTSTNPPAWTTSAPINIDDSWKPLEAINRHQNFHLLEHKICGPHKETKIYGGDDAGMFEFPWMALLSYNVIGFKKQGFYCGGTIINKRYILTAAHCVTNLPKNLTLTSVRVGEFNLSTDIDCDLTFSGEKINCAEKYKTLGIEKTVIHQDFNNVSLHNDIALIRLNSTLDFKPYSVKPICLPVGLTAKTFLRTAVVTGWGATQKSQMSDTLLKVTVPIVTNEKCTRAYTNRVASIWHKQMCAGGVKKMDSCKGDSGGPLQQIVLHNGRYSMVQFGIVSFGMTNCGLSNVPGIYTKLAYYVRWILDNLEE